MGTGATGATADPLCVQVSGGRGSSMDKGQPWGLRVSWPLLSYMTTLWKTVEAPGPWEDLAVETPLAQTKPQPAKNELLELAHRGEGVDLVSFSSHTGHG